MAFLDTFPLVNYDIYRSKLSTFDSVVNITYRIGIIKNLLDNISVYFNYTVREGETPDILADKVYGNPEAHWIILYANDIYDPQYDWPLDYKPFQNYIISKYGSIANAKTSIHHYEKVIEREESSSGTITVNRYEINQANITINLSSTLENVPYDTYNELPETGEWITFNFGNGKSVRQKTYRNAVSNYDYEEELNNQKRQIKIINREYYPQIMNELSNMTGQGMSNMRRLI